MWWGWGLNGAASVLGSVLAVLVAMTWGFTPASVLGGAAYVAALVAAAGIEQKPATPAGFTETAGLTAHRQPG